MNREIYDIVIIGGGVNGCGIARDAAGRGLDVLLAEKNDLASGTSSASTKLIHGGLRYLEHYEFRLVREALREREVLLAAAPHIIKPMRFILPHHSALRPRWLIRIGLFIYDHLGARKVLAPSRMIDLRRGEAGAPLQAQFTSGFEYSDCAVDDARLVALSALDAAERGAEIKVRCKMISAIRKTSEWHITLQDKDSEQTRIIRARALVNAAGPWVGDVARRSDSAAAAKLRLVKGSHIVVPKIFEHDRAYILQNQDRRIIFAIPYQDDFTLIGTTDVDVRGAPGAPGSLEASDTEIDYLCRAVSAYFKTPVSPRDVVWSFAGIRPLYNDGGASAQETTRDYVLELEGDTGEAPQVNIYGGKITTFRELSEDVLAKLAPSLPHMGPDWTHFAVLPGGDFEVGDLDALVSELIVKHPALSLELLRRLCHAYGTRAKNIVSGVETLADMGRCFGADLYEREVEYLRTREWARSAEDILWRRSKLGLRLGDDEVAALSEWMQGQV